MALVTVPRYTVDDLDRFPEDGNRGAGKIVRDTIEWHVPGTSMVAHVPLPDVFQGVS